MELFRAIHSNKPHMFSYWIKNNNTKEYFNKYFDNDGYTPLMAAITDKNINILKLLIKGEADPNMPMNKDPYWHPLECAIMQDNSAKNNEIIELLLEAGADKENALRDALSIEAPFENIKVLIDNGVKVNTPGGISPLEYAISHCRLDVVNLLIDEGAHVNMHSSDGTTPLIAAIRGIGCTDKIPIIELLIKSHADLNKKDDHDSTPLEVAVIYRYRDIVRILLDAGAKIDKKTILKAAKYGYTDIVHMLLEAGAPIDKKIIDEATHNIKPILTAWVRGKDTKRANTILNKTALPAELRGEITSYLSGTKGRRGVQHGPRLPGREVNYTGNQIRELEETIGRSLTGGTRRARRRHRLTRKN
jgi:ankyrin repeat protein